MKIVFKECWEIVLTWRVSVEHRVVVLWAPCASAQPAAVLLELSSGFEFYIPSKQDNTEKWRKEITFPSVIFIWAAEVWKKFRRAFKIIPLTVNDWDVQITWTSDKAQMDWNVLSSVIVLEEIGGKYCLEQD